MQQCHLYVKYTLKMKSKNTIRRERKKKLMCILSACSLIKYESKMINISQWNFILRNLKKKYISINWNVNNIVWIIITETKQFLTQFNSQIFKWWKKANKKTPVQIICEKWKFFLYLISFFFFIMFRTKLTNT